MDRPKHSVSASPSSSQVVKTYSLSSCVGDGEDDDTETTEPPRLDACLFGRISVRADELDVAERSRLRASPSTG